MNLSSYLTSSILPYNIRANKISKIVLVLELDVHIRVLSIIS